MKRLLPLFALLFTLACNGSTLGVPVEGGPDVESPEYPPAPMGMALPIPQPTGDAGALCNVPPGSTPFWGDCTGVGTAGTVLPDGGAGAIWYESDAGQVSALPIGTQGQTLIVDGGVPYWITVSGSSGGSTTLPDAGQGGMWMQDAGAGVPYAVPIGATDQVLTVSAAAPNWKTGIDSTGALPVGGTSATSVTVGNATTTAGVAVDVEPGNAFSATIGSNVAVSFGGATTDFVCFDGASCATTGYERFPSGVNQTLIESGTQAILATTTANHVNIDSASNLDLGGSNATFVFIGNTTNTSESWTQLISGGNFQVLFGGTSDFDLTSSSLVLGASSSYALNFLSTVSNATIGWSGSASAGGAGLSINGQNAGGSANNGGDVAITGGGGTTTGIGGGVNLTSGVGGGTGTPGNVILNISPAVGSNHGFISFQEGAVGYLQVAPAYSASYAPAPAATVNPPNTYLYGSSPNGSCGSSATCSPGIVNVNISAVGATGSPTEGYFAVNRANSIQFAAGALPGSVGTYGSIWLTPGATPSGTNFSVISSSVGSYMNGATLDGLAIAGTAYAELTTGRWSLFGAVASAGTYNWEPVSGTTNTQTNAEYRVVYNLRTAATTTATVATIAVPASHARIIHAKIIGRLAAAAFTAGACETVGTFSNNGGTVSQAGSTTAISAQALTCAMSISGANVNVTVFGQTSSNTDFMAVVDVTDD